MRRGGGADWPSQRPRADAAEPSESLFPAPLGDAPGPTRLSARLDDAEHASGHGKDERALILADVAALTDAELRKLATYVRLYLPGRRRFGTL